MRRCPWAFVWLVSCAGAWAQAPAPPPAGTQPAAPQGPAEIVSHEAPASFTSRVNLVSVPVVIRDRDGRAIGNLRQEDFEVFDKGRAQVITKFTVETSAGTSGGSAAAPVAKAPQPGAPASSQPPVLPERFVAYLFDDVHMKPADLLNARQAANRQLDRTLDATSRTAIFTTSGRTTQDFTADVDKLHAAVNRIQPWTQGPDKQKDCPYFSYYLADLLINQSDSLSPGLSENQVMQRIGVDMALNAVLQEAEACLQTTNLEVVLPQLRMAAQQALSFGKEESAVSMSVLRDLVRSMSALPGSRTVVMVGPGFIVPMEHRFNENEVFDKAIHANVTINTLDIRGVATPAGFEASDRGFTSAAAAQMMQLEQSAANAAQDLLAEVAAGTGGRFFHNDNGLEEGIQQLAARPEYAYILGFSPDNLKFDGSYHRLKVTLKNGAKYQAEARHGYWAPNHAVDPVEAAKEEVEDAVFSREEMLTIPVKVHTEFFKQSEAKAQLTVETRVDLKGLKFKKADDRNRDNLTVITSLFDENGRYIKGTERTFEMQLRDQTLDAARNKGLTIKEGFDVTPGRYVARVVVRDSEGNSMAAQNAGIEIP
jgi:VWFA-related protein